MNTNAPQPTNDDIKRELDEIKTALGIRTTSVLDDIMEKFVAIENRLNTIEHSQRVRSQRLYWLDAGLILMVAGLTIVLPIVFTGENAIIWGIVIFLIGLLCSVFGPRYVK